MKRIALFVLTNLAVVFVLNITLTLTGVNRYLETNGINYSSLLLFSIIVGFTGSIISLFMSKKMAIISMGVHIIDHHTPANSHEAWLVDTVHQLADRAGIKHPDVGIYQGAPNAFATGAFKDEALVAVSTGLLQSMDKEEITAVLGHEISHITNGDMVTLTLIQGVVNTFVIFFARIVATFIDRRTSTHHDEHHQIGMGYYMTTMVCEMVFGVLASIIVAWFSRQREYRADAGAAQLLGSTQPMIKALARLGNLEPGELGKGMQAMGISEKMGIMALFATHPPLENRIRALQQLGD